MNKIAAILVANVLITLSTCSLAYWAVRRLDEQAIEAALANRVVAQAGEQGGQVMLSNLRQSAAKGLNTINYSDGASCTLTCKEPSVDGGHSGK